MLGKEKLFWIVIAVIILLILGVGGYIAYNQYWANANTQVSKDNNVTEISYPAETKRVEDKSKNTVSITPSQKDAVQVETANGTTVVVTDPATIMSK